MAKDAKEPGIGVTKILARYAANLRYEDIPAEVVSRTREVVLDCVGELLAGSTYPVGRVTAKYVGALGEKGPCTVACSSKKVAPVTAAFANAATSHCLELDDNYNPANAHVANIVLPAALALAEMRHLEGKTLITALVAAYDVGGRVGIVLNPVRLYERSFHPSSVGGNFSGAVAAARVLGLDEGRMLSALGLAGCQASGLLAWVTEPGQFSKSFQIGAASRNGVAGALLAEAGFTGPPHILEGNHNVFFAFSGLAPTGELTQELGTRFEITRTSFKKYACCRQIHAPLDGLFKIMNEHGLRAEDIRSLTTRVASSMADIIDGNELPSHNAQYVLAVAALDGKVELEQLAGGRAGDPKVLGLSQSVRVVGDTELEKLFPRQWSGITTVTTRKGQEFTEAVYYPKGDPENPLTPEEVRNKFMGLAIKAVSTERAEQILRAVASLEEMKDVSELMGLLAI